MTSAADRWPLDLEIAPGQVIRGATLRGEITDEQQFRAAHHDDPALELLIAAGTGALEEALGEADRLVAAGDTLPT